LDRNDLGGYFRGSRDKATDEMQSPWHRSLLAFVFVSHRLLFSLSEVCPELQQEKLRYSQGN
jgi:hypothetical protein